jgi:hypothetical protein
MDLVRSRGVAFARLRIEMKLKGLREALAEISQRIEKSWQSGRNQLY